MIYERPSRYRYAKASNGKRYPTWPVWYREWSPIKKHYRVLDCEDAYDSDDFYKVEVRIKADPAYTEYVNPTEKQRLDHRRKARLRAEAIVREIETYKQIAVWRKRLIRAKNEFDFVWEPYEKALRRKYRTTAWRWQRQYEAYQKEMNDALRRREQQMRERSEEHVEGLQQRAYGLARIREGMKWIESFDNPYFTRIVVKIMDDQKTLSDQVDVINKIFNAAHDGRLQPMLEELNRRAGLYV